MTQDVFTLIEGHDTGFVTTRSLKDFKLSMARNFGAEALMAGTPLNLRTILLTAILRDSTSWRLSNRLTCENLGECHVGQYR